MLKPVSLSLTVHMELADGVSVNLSLLIDVGFVERATDVPVSYCEEEHSLSLFRLVVTLYEKALLTVGGDILFPPLRQAWGFEPLVISLRNC